MIDERETISADGTLTHGQNSVVSVLYNALETHGFGEMACVLHAHNCVVNIIIIINVFEPN